MREKNIVKRTNNKSFDLIHRTDRETLSCLHNCPKTDQTFYNICCLFLQKEKKLFFNRSILLRYSIK